MSWFRRNRPQREALPSQQQSQVDGWASQFLPDYDAKAPAIATQDGRTIVAGKHALWVVGKSGLESSGLWHEVQYCSWEAQTQTFSVSWIDSTQPAVVALTQSEDPKRFMSIVTNRVDKTIVLSQSQENGAGGTVTASVRRRPDGKLFSLVFLRGSEGVRDQEIADRLEKVVRDELGMDA